MDTCVNHIHYSILVRLAVRTGYDCYGANAEKDKKSYDQFFHVTDTS